MPHGIIEAAKAALAEARKLNVTQYAQEELRQAESALQSAIDQLAKQNHSEARSFALRAKERAELALQKTRANQLPGTSPTSATPVAGSAAKAETSTPQPPPSPPQKPKKQKKQKPNAPRQGSGPAGDTPKN